MVSGSQSGVVSLSMALSALWCLVVSLVWSVFPWHCLSYGVW
jgi:hypothetical protein